MKGMLRFGLAIALSVVSCAAAHAQDTGVAGDWREPGGSVLRVFNCGDEVCMKVMVLRPKEPLHFDIHNPDPASRSHPICGLQIGSAFHPQGPAVAKDGRIYDPESGHTYHAQMHTEDGQLRLRGYILFPALGRTEKWQRVDHLTQTCQ